MFTATTLFTLALLSNGASEPDTVGVAAHSFGVAVDGDEVIAGGPRYRARFDREGFVFTPALGRAAATSAPLAFRLESIRLGGEILHEARPTDARADGQSVVYSRSSTIEERYAVSRAGIEQSYVFTQLPDARGDLVVRGRLETDLLPRASADGLVFERPGVGGLEYGGVTGIDAAGRSTPGSLRLDGNWLELSLPADFVANAELPLVLDPLIGNSFLVAGSQDDGAPDAAYSVTGNMYLVVYERHFSAADVDIRGQRIDGNGNLIGGSMFLESNATVTALSPSVACNNTTNMFFVAWQEAPGPFGPWDVRGRSVAAQTGLPESIVTVAGNPSLNEVAPDVGGDAAIVDDQVLVVWLEENLGVRGRQVTVGTGVTPIPFTGFTITSDPDDGPPAISKSGGASGTYLVVHARYYDTPSPGDNDVLGTVIDRNGTILYPFDLVAGVIGVDERNPDVDGDGERFFVAFERAEDSLTSDSDVYVVKVDYEAGVFTEGDAVPVAAAIGEAERDPAVADMGSKVFVAWSDEFSFLDYDMLFRGLDPNGCKPCGVVTSGALGARHDGRPALVSRLSGSPTAPDEGLLVWDGSDLTAPFDSDVFAQRLEAVGSGGSVVDHGGGCGGGGDISTVGGIAVGSPSFSVRVKNADPAATTAFLAINPIQQLFPCGPCEWLIWNTSFVFPAALVDGATEVNLPMPCSLTSTIGFSLFAQWTIVGTSTTACSTFPNIGFSDRLQLVIGS